MGAVLRDVLGTGIGAERRTAVVDRAAAVRATADSVVAAPASAMPGTSANTAVAVVQIATNDPNLMTWREGR